ncbi:MAG: signal peptidase II [Deltaproteobacteria bacterium]|nr:signal peptidase II [Deltaproteobacteria bacterium]
MTKPDADKTSEPTPPATPPPSLRPRSMQALALAIFAAAGLTALDIWAKTWAEDNLSRARSGEAPALCEEEDGYIAYQRIRGDSQVIVEDVLDLEYAENCGAAFGLMRNAPAIARRVVFGIAAAVAVSALFFLFYQGRGGSLFAWSVPLVASGALGNLIDRIRYGYVVDFIHVHYEPWDFDYPTFNVADITITIGVILLVIDSFRAEPVPAEAPPADVKKDVRDESAASATTEPSEPTAASDTETKDEPASEDREPAADPERA